MLVRFLNSYTLICRDPIDRACSSYGDSYFLTTVDDFSRCLWIYLLYNQLKVETMFLCFVALIWWIDNLVKQSNGLSDNDTEIELFASLLFGQWYAF